MKSMRHFSKYPCLTRDFIYDRLYHPSQGYFNQKDIQIGELKEPINFSKMMGYQDYSREVSEKYPQNAWLTPSELFKPWYGMSIGNYIHQVHQKTKGPLKIIEIGAGAGSAADSILMFFKNYDQKLYDTLQYEIVEISSVMGVRAKQKLGINHDKLVKNNQISIVQDDIVNYRNDNKDENTFLLFLEVFDNMPHDRVYKDKGEYTLQTMVEKDTHGKYKESFEAISDPLIKEVLEVYLNLPERAPLEQSRLQISLFEKMFNLFYKRSLRQKSLFLPTHCYKILKNIQRNFPKHHLISADFDNLGSLIEGINAPIVSKKLAKSHEKHDFDSYFVERGEADIFFPTDFHLLQHLYKKACNRDGEQVKSFTFVDNFSRDDWTMTKSGYNPLKEDFMNTSFFVTSIN